MIFNPDIHHRRSIRLQGYDYSRNGAYFVTLCTKNRCCFFEMFGSLRRIVDLQWQSIPERFPDVVLDEYVIMPNHLHGIFIIGRDIPCGYPEFVNHQPGHPQGAPRRKPTVGDIVGSFKSLCVNNWLKTIRAEKLDAIGTFWQSNYYEHVVRDDGEMERIRRYIAENPLKWELDWENPANNKQQQDEQWMV